MTPAVPAYLPDSTQRHRLQGGVILFVYRKAPNTDQFEVLIGRRLLRAERMLPGRPKKLSQNETITKKAAAQRIAKEHGVSRATVYRAAKTAEFVDALPAEQKQAIMAGKKRIVEVKREVKEQHRSPGTEEGRREGQARRSRLRARAREGEKC
jgi:hypothetical protein